jgi:hypothetical protein
MTRSDRFFTAVHEAGHVAAGWLLGASHHAVHLAGPDRTVTDGRGRVVREVAGLVEDGLSYNIHPGMPPAYVMLADQPEVLANARRYGIAAAAVRLAGPLAEARYRHLSQTYVALNWGRGDLARVEEIAADLWRGGPSRGDVAFMIMADRLAIRLLRGRMPAVVVLARELHRAGSLDGDRLDALLPELLGPCPPFLAAVGDIGDALERLMRDLKVEASPTTDG